MPRRMHKSWQYPRPIRRYGHYSLLQVAQEFDRSSSHREFVTMLMGLTMVSFLEIVIDLWVAVLVAKVSVLQSKILVALRLA